MRHARTGSALLCVLLLFAAQSSAQALSPFTAPATRTHTAGAAGRLASPSAGSPNAVVATFLRSRGIAVADADLVAVAATAARNGITVRRFEERVGGLSVFGVYAKAAFSSDGALVHLIENVVAAPSASTVAARVSEVQALRTALAALYPGQAINPNLVDRRGNTATFEHLPFFHEAPTVTRVAVPRDGGFVAGLLVNTWSQKENLLHETLIGPEGNVDFVERRTNNDSYFVFLEDPSKGGQTIVRGPAAGGIYSPNGWLSSSSQSTANITGNNVNAYLDVDTNNRADKGGTAVTSGDFLTSANLAAAPSTAGNRAVAVQNLFYLNNVLHDRLYQHGFTESAGNFQVNNFSRGGASGDAVLAEAQDGGGTDNANFSTPSDGRAPRMQMYLWTGAGADHQLVVTAPSGVAGTYGARGAEFGPALTTTGLTQAIVVVNDGSGVTTDACEPVQASVKGRIALADRGSCDFVTKARNVQSAGAVGLIVGNNQGGTDIIVMGGSDRQVRIPAIMISQFDGATLKAAAGLAGTMRKNPNPPLQLDGSVDSDIVFHEYGHGLTWRMIGGMSGPLAGAIGEGASDGIAMLFNGDDRIGEYSASNPNGIRRNPYAGYPRTYGAVTGAEVHDDGEIYAAIIWRLKENFEAAGVTNAVDVLLDYYVDGMNYTPATPAFEDMRDGIVAAAAPAHKCLVWDAFADFGVGVGAKGQTVSSTSVTVTESFATPATCP